MFSEAQKDSGSSFGSWQPGEKQAAWRWRQLSSLPGFETRAIKQPCIMLFCGFLATFLLPLGSRGGLALSLIPVSLWTEIYWAQCCRKVCPPAIAPRAGERHARCAEHLMRGCNFSVAKGSGQVMRVWEALCFSRKRFPHVSGRAMSMESWVQSLDQPGCGIL